MKNKKVLLLGSSGWVAHYVIPDLVKMGFEVIGFSNSKKPHHDIENFHYDIENENYFSEIKEVECDLIINMLHSKNYDRSFEVHCNTADYCKDTNKHYTYMSSSNAIDGDVTRPHYENEKAFGGSEYGKYKARCEHYLYENMPEALIIRFPATHGFAPNRISRTEEFLQKLQNGEKVPCYKGVYQGRPFVGHLSKMITKAVSELESGIFHLSTLDESDQIDFLTKVANEFGYTDDQVVIDKEINWNMTITPKKIFEKYGDDYKFIEDDTIRMLGECSHLSKYKKRN
jgi:dTDP-4-dehydrorhamnose reductase